MKLWILSTVPPASEDTAYLIGRAASRCTKAIVSPVAADAEEPPPAPEENFDIILNRSFISRTGFLHSLDALAAERRVLLTNPGVASARACDKRTYLEDFQDLAPMSWVAHSLEELIRIQSDWAGELVLKDPFGKRGKDVIRFRGEEDAGAADELLARMKDGGVVAQAFCQGFVAGDKRVILHRNSEGGFDLAAWFKRVPKAGEWKSNLTAGGRIEPCELEKEEIKLAMEVAERAKLDSIGIDLAWHEGRCLLIETNAYTGGHIDFDSDRKVHSGDEFAKMILYLVEKGAAR